MHVLEKPSPRIPSLSMYKVLAVVSSLSVMSMFYAGFFDTFPRDYAGDAFNRWFNRKSDEPAYVCYESKTLVAVSFLP